MAVGHVFARPSAQAVFIIILALFLFLVSTSNDIYFNSNRCVLFRRVSSLCQSGKLPSLKWSKRGQAIMTMPYNLCIVVVDIILFCGDVHPQPGPFQRAKGVSKKVRTEDSKSFTDQTRKSKTSHVGLVHLNIRSLASRKLFYYFRLQRIILFFDGKE